MLAPAFLDEVRDRTTLSALVGRDLKLTRAGHEFKARCPFHEEKTPSFWVNDAKGFYHCFGCGANGDAIRWLTEHHGLAFIDAVTQLVDAAGMTMPARDPRQATRAAEQADLYGIMDQAERRYRAALHSPAGGAAQAYLERRGISIETARAFGLGRAPDSRTWIARELGDVADRDLVRAGLLVEVEGKDRYDRFRDRLIVPIRDGRGRTIAFGGRALGGGEPKYLNSPETPLFSKGSVLYNLDRAAPHARKNGRIVVVEGYLDVIGLSQVGIGETVAPLGTALTAQQIVQLWRVAEAPILCFDGDKAGRAAARRAAGVAMAGIAPGRTLRFAHLPTGQDPDDLAREGGRVAVDRVLDAAEGLADFLWRAESAETSLDTPEQRAALEQRLMAHADAITDRTTRAEYRREFGARCRTAFRQLAGRSPSNLLRGVPVGEGPGLPVTLRLGMMVGFLRFPEAILGHVEDLAQVDLPFSVDRLRQRMIAVALTTSDITPQGLLYALADDERATADDLLGPASIRCLPWMPYCAPEWFQDRYKIARPDMIDALSVMVADLANHPKKAA